jgi:hypothetical protein
LEERVEREILDSDISDDIPKLDVPAEDTEVMKEDSVKEEEVDLTHLPTADDTESFDNYINNLNQEKIENMSEQEIIHMNAELARKLSLRTEPEKKKKHSKSKKGKK